ncbi:hypothetical protein KCM76_25800 [Zooshikella marina]|uniref:hypothetical protein n=1 Tax=Zooshikella ganghwensis TaxID=202772 RepID=UPI001C04C36F|nr:hypothetical protein [Zooshikella ganghwensis]MBU2709430.1 hypothetical protein [Zooshikella ganghwensis]
MYQESDIRELLIETCYSNEQANAFFEERLEDEALLEILVYIAFDEDDYGGDAPMASGDYIPRFPAESLKQFEPQFLSILETEWASARHEDIALALAKINSIKGKELTEKWLSELGEGPRYEKFKQAYEQYE